MSSSKYKQRVHSMIYFLGVILTTIVTCRAVDIEYLPTKCDGQTSITTSLHLESGTALRYHNDVSCSYTLQSPTDKRILVSFQRFDFEHKSNGVCLDYLNLYDGSNVNAAKLNTDPLCGTILPANYNTSGQTVTVSMVTDSTGVAMGFGLLFTVIYNGPCLNDDFACANGICIPTSLECNGLNQCGDNSDETSCSAEDIILKYGKDNALMIAGIIIGSLALIVLIIVVSSYIYKRNKWKRFLNTHDADNDTIWEIEPAYPVTGRYFKGNRGRPNYNTLQETTDSERI